MSTDTIEAPPLPQLVSQLPEVYQPLYGHPEFDRLVSRKGGARLEELRAIVAALRQRLGRPVKVLDLGCAQGWVSLHLAEAGATVLGIDHFGKNIAVCQALAAENPGLRARFERADVERLAGRLQDGEFDLFLGLSVFHHLCVSLGKDAVRGLIESYLARIPNAVLEIALSTEAPAWAKAQPESPEFFVQRMPFATLLSINATHLRSARPLYFCSRVHWYREGRLGDLSEAHRN